ncbi:AI-2E family transporter [Candidatus Marinarcus aquaticus]|uniref:AI-2E family transporter n=1 Tax=Candidatus Marinarcus aquaticus TaxID=2044504 RepID=A0A4Q0XST6_9BACT|nr:AI-2E family transporter [Candidatus Marinarcus aquaticus]RXJ56285.1 AI-2E family transporter [Candidatus Marinarcus aquaticus]
MKPQHFLLGIAAIVLYFLADLFQPFLKAILVALLLAIATNSIFNFVLFRFKNRLFSSVFMTLFLGAVFFIPLMYFIFSFINYVNHMDKQAIMNMYDFTLEVVNRLPNEYAFIKEHLNRSLEQINIATMLEKTISFGALLGKNSARFMIDMVLILTFYFFMNLYNKEFSSFIIELIPLNHEDSKALFNESSNVMSIVLYSILVTAIFEGFLFGFFINLFGYDGILYGVLYGFASLIPIIGGALMWLPVALYEMFTGSLYNAIYIALYSIIIISIIADTFIKPMIIKYINKRVVKTPTAINELLIFFSIVAGLSTIGFWGMIIGPALVTFFISIMQLIKKQNKLNAQTEV